MTNKILGVGLVAVAIIAILGLYRPVSQITKVPSEQVVNLGATGTENTNKSITYNGLRMELTGKVMATATTTVCSIQAPTYATSSLMFASASFRTSSTTASTVTLAKDTTAFATTTLIGNRIGIAANGQATIVASTTATQLATGVTTFAPGSYFNVSMEGGAGTYSPVGRCSAQFVVTY